MKVGVYFNDMAPEAGGGFTFQDNILQSLLEVSNESRHAFTIFAPRPERLRTPLTDSRIEVAPYHRTLAERIVNRLTRWIPPIREVRKFASEIDRTARMIGIEFMWFVSNMYVPVNIPYLCTVWDLQHRLQPWFPELNRGGEWYVRDAYYSDMLRRATAIVAGTEVGREEIIRFYQVPPGRIRILPHPTPRFAFDALNRGMQNDVLTKYNIPPGYLFYPAQLWPHKNHAGLLMAVRILREQHGLALPVVFVGSDKGNESYIKRLVDQLNLSGQVYFLGFVPQEDLVQLYRNAFALTYLTFFGPENLPPLEAFALGCPVVASAVSGAKEQLGDAALLVDPTDEDQIASAIKSLHENPELRRRVVQRGLDRASIWTGKDFVRGIFSIIDEFEPIRRCWGR